LLGRAYGLDYRISVVAENLVLDVVKKTHRKLLFQLIMPR
jgi:hypothetical protein